MFNNRYSRYNNNNTNNNNNNRYNNTLKGKFAQPVPQNDTTVDIETKRQILEYVYRLLDLGQYKYYLLKYECELPQLKEKSAYVSPNYNGLNSLLVFVKIKNRYLSVIIDRKTLTYNINQIDYNTVKIIPIQYRLEESIYDGSIFDGVLLYNGIDGLKHFVINDVYYLKGKRLIDDKLSNKMVNISAYLDTITDDRRTNNVVFIVNKLYELNAINPLINVYIPKSKYNKSIKGVAFYPEYSGTKLIYLYSNCNEEDEEVTTTPVQKTYKFVPKFDESPKEKEKDQVIKSVAVFKMRKSGIIDVYNLYLGKKVFDETIGKNLFKYKKISMAYIPTKECSAFCKKLFEESKNEEILVECRYDAIKNKWIPTSPATDRKWPDLEESIMN